MVFGTISILRDRTQAEERLLKQRHKPDKPNVNNMASKSSNVEASGSTAAATGSSDVADIATLVVKRTKGNLY